jgi:hypothetical protein
VLPRTNWQSNTTPTLTLLYPDSAGVNVYRVLARKLRLSYEDLSMVEKVRRTFEKFSNKHTHN